MKPLYKVIIFAIYPIIYLLLGYLNYSLAGKFTLIGILFVGSFVYLYYYKPNKFTKIVAITAILIMFLHIAYRSILQDVFHMNQDAIVVIESILGTNAQESLEFFQQYWTYILKHIAIFILFLSTYLYLIFKVKTEGKVTFKYLATIMTLFLIIHLNPIRRSDPIYFYPYYYNQWQQNLKEVRELKTHIDSQIESLKLNIKYIGKEQEKTVVWIIGESSTRVNWSLYGYSRDTTPQINSIKDELLIMKNTVAAGPITIPSVERMLTSATKNRPNRWKEEPSVLQYAKMAGFKTYWITNQTTDAQNGILKVLASSAGTFIETNRGSSRGEGSFDNTLLKPFKKALEDKSNKKFIVVHMIGSHPAYNFRYPKKFNKFTYTFDDKVMQNLKRKGRAKWAIVFRNLYDNSILYSDYIRYSLINILKHSKCANNSSLLYISDHGEDVCHNSNFSGHNPKAKQQWMVPMILWPKYKTKALIDENKKFYADKLDKLILKMLEIQI